jgi:hypothetical protein
MTPERAKMLEKMAEAASIMDILLHQERPHPVQFQAEVET